MKLVTRTPNGVGIAPGRPILFNAGISYTGVLPTNVQDASERNTRFRGRLDQLFLEGHAGAQLSVRGPGPVEVDEKKIHDAMTTPMKRKDLPQSSPESSEKNPTEGPSQKCQTKLSGCSTPAAGGGTGANGTNGGSTGANGAGGGGTGADGTKSGGQTTSPGDQAQGPGTAKFDLGTKLATGTSPFMYSVWLTAENTLHIKNDEKANKKLPKDWTGKK